MTHENSIRADEREKTIFLVLDIINKNCFELEGKRLRITLLQLCQEIDLLRKKDGD
jgi:hypothetical protein